MKISVAILTACCLILISHAALSQGKENPYTCRNRADTGFDTERQEAELREVEDEIKKLGGATECRLSDVEPEDIPIEELKLACLYTTKAEIYK